MVLDVTGLAASRPIVGRDGFDRRDLPLQPPGLVARAPGIGS